MPKLFIIGNGFDRAHGLKTSYWNFRNYLKKNAEEFLIKLEHMYSIEPFDNLDPRNKRNKEIQKRRDDAIYNILWKNFESDLGEVNETEMLSFSKSIVDDLEDLDGGPIVIKDTLDQYWEEEYSFILQLNDYVAKWIKQVRLSKAVPLKSDFTNNYEDFFFTFNYTSVLERIYHIPSNHILHIHGGLMPYCDEPPIVGHGNIEKVELYHKIAEKAANEYDEGNESINNAIAKFYERTLKKTSECMAYKDDFFGQLTEVDHVEIIGHSFGRVDMPYFIHLKQCISEKTKWKFYCYSSKDFKAAENVAKILKLDDEKYEIIHSDQFWK